MYTVVKNEEEIKNMRESGKILGHVLKVLSSKISPGMSTKDIAEIAKIELKPTGGLPTFLGYNGFPDVICISVNDEIVHGIPKRNKIIKDGDKVSLDFGVTYNGMITDSATSIIVGTPKSKADVELLKNTKQSLYAGISVLKDGVRVGDISDAIQKILDRYGYGIVRDLVGHGVGHDLHEDPNIPNYGQKGSGPILKSGMTIAIEPMATLGSYKIIEDTDGWSIRSADGSMSAHFEHTILITGDGYEVLTENT
ncbi:MAG TPA: type I methionyl aminopeptidase [Candidatus Saccharimonadales bacterium]|jgi:methionyl aminopeptidase|nr:type I methionyl aminopeptidase [Candidatus Saccharimonadales bacterium]